MPHWKDSLEKYITENAAEGGTTAAAQ
jgi:hypothetical protein